MERILVEGCEDAKQKKEEVFDCCRVESKKEKKGKFGDTPTN